MTKQYKVTMMLTFDEDLTDKTLSSDELPGLGDETMQADEAILHEITGRAWDACLDAGLKIEGWDYRIEEVDE